MPNEERRIATVDLHLVLSIRYSEPTTIEPAAQIRPMRPERHRGRSCPARGFTLMEMLIVIVIMVAITSVMIPVMVASSDARKMREAARLVNTMLASAQSRAISSGRSVGVLFQPMKNNPYACMDIYLVESPPPYAGDTNGYRAAIVVNATAIPPNMSVVINNGTAAGGNYGQPTFGGLPMAPDTQPNQQNTQLLIRPGDLIQFNHRGQLYILNFGDSTPFAVSHDSSHSPPWCKMTITPTDPSAGFPPATPSGSAGVEFEIFRQPVKTMDPPAQLADGTAVDWYFSGVDVAPPQSPTGKSNTTYPNNVQPNTKTWNSSYPPPGYAPAMFGACGTINPSSSTPPAPGPAAMSPNCGPVVVTFNSSGTLDQVYYSCTYPTAATPPPTYYYQTRPLSGAYFLVGDIARIQQGGGPIQNDAANLPNYQYVNARWVSVTRQSGLVTTTEVASLPPAYCNFPASGTPTAYVTNPNNPKPNSTTEWAGVLNAVMQSRRFAASNQASNGQ